MISTDLCNLAARQTVFASPIFMCYNVLGQHFGCLYGQEDLYRSIWNCTQDEIEVKTHLGEEYFAIAQTLSQMGKTIPILYSDILAESPVLKAIEYMKRFGFSRADLSSLYDVDIRTFSYPRDIVTMLPNGHTYIDSEMSGFALQTDVMSMQGEVSVSPIGQGGRILCWDEYVLMGQMFCLNDGFCPVRSNSFLLTEDTKKIEVPNTVIFEDYGFGGLRGIGVDDHMDRSTNRLIDKKGKCHLITDSCVFSGYQFPFVSPRFTPKETIAEYQRICDQNEVIFHPAPPTIVPMAIGFHQFQDGTVIMTSGDDELSWLVADIIGSENLFLTPIPIIHTPVWCKAGIRCLIGELPEWMFNKSR